MGIRKLCGCRHDPANEVRNRQWQKRQATSQGGQGAAVYSLLDEAGSKQVVGLWNLSDQDWSQATVEQLDDGLYCSRKRGKKQAPVLPSGRARQSRQAQETGRLSPERNRKRTQNRSRVIAPVFDRRPALDDYNPGCVAPDTQAATPFVIGVTPSVA